MNTTTNHGAAIPLPEPSAVDNLLRRFRADIRVSEKTRRQLLEGSWEPDGWTPADEEEKAEHEAIERSRVPGHHSP